MTLPRHIGLAVALLLATLSFGGCALGTGAGDTPADEAELGGKEDSPFAQEGGPCVTSFDCEVGLECIEGGCAPRATVCEDDR